MVVAASSGLEAILVTTELTATASARTLDLRQRGLLSAEHRSLAWKCTAQCAGVGSVAAVRKAKRMVAQLQKVIKMLVSAECLGSWETGDLPSRL